MTINNEWASAKRNLCEQAIHVRNMSLDMWKAWLYWVRQNDS